MTLESAYFISQIVSTVAVLTSLIYLAVQIKQAQRNQRALIEQGRASRSTDMFAILASDADVVSRFMRGDDTLSEGELMKATLIFRMLMINFEENSLQHQAKLLDDVAWETTRAAMRSVFANIGMLSLWTMLRPTYSPRIAAVVDGLLLSQGSEVLAPGLLASAWRATLAEQRAKITAAS